MGLLYLARLRRQSSHARHVGIPADGCQWGTSFSDVPTTALRVPCVTSIHTNDAIVLRSVVQMHVFHDVLSPSRLLIEYYDGVEWNAVKFIQHNVSSIFK